VADRANATRGRNPALRLTPALSPAAKNAYMMMRHRTSFVVIRDPIPRADVSFILEGPKSPGPNRAKTPPKLKSFNNLSVSGRHLLGSGIEYSGPDYGRLLTTMLPQHKGGSFFAARVMPELTVSAHARASLPDGPPDNAVTSDVTFPLRLTGSSSDSDGGDAAAGRCGLGCKRCPLTCLEVVILVFFACGWILSTLAVTGFLLARFQLCAIMILPRSLSMMGSLDFRIVRRLCLSSFEFFFGECLASRPWGAVVSVLAL
jgi:hypothetical protein